MSPKTKTRLSTWATHFTYVGLGLTLICGCVLEPRTDQLANYASWRSASVGNSNASTDPAQTSRAALFRVLRELDRAYHRFDLRPPHPKIRIVNAEHDILEGGAIAVAAITDQGEERIYFNRDYLNAGHSIASATRHEVAHLAAWRQHGLQIAPHGPEFKAICWAATSRADCTAQQPPMIGRK
ncbi:MAG: SprT-like domain-containing protein [Hyphomonadaceae bacterium]|nr:SprT-like domain-containing protein [Hyphomonadaceae bacterium]